MTLHTDELHGFHAAMNCLQSSSAPERDRRNRWPTRGVLPPISGTRLYAREQTRRPKPLPHLPSQARQPGI